MKISKSAAKKMIPAYSDLVPTSTPNLADSQHVSENISMEKTVATQ